MSNNDCGIFTAHAKRQEYIRKNAAKKTTGKVELISRKKAVINNIIDINKYKASISTGRNPLDIA
ncbi:MAG: hypothetical protein GY760_07270 [Deltaproteobacteria bacterium]|nr:hypothetical protein [Deltaproteobacteria bacterium]